MQSMSPTDAYLDRPLPPPSPHSITQLHPPTHPKLNPIFTRTGVHTEGYTTYLV